jgi:hypothetical protein
LPELIGPSIAISFGGKPASTGVSRRTISAYCGSSRVIIQDRGCLKDGLGDRTDGKEE